MGTLHARARDDPTLEANLSTRKKSSTAEGGGASRDSGERAPQSGVTEGVSDGAEGTIWSGGPNRGANAPAGAATRDVVERGMADMRARFAEVANELYVSESGV